MLQTETHPSYSKEHLFLTPGEYYYLAFKLLAQILPHKDWYHCIYGIPRGGLPLAVFLSHHLDLPLLTSLSGEFKSHHILVVDDILDTGETTRKLHISRDFLATLFISDSVKEAEEPYYWVERTKMWVVFPYEKEAIEK